MITLFIYPEYGHFDMRQNTIVASLSFNIHSYDILVKSYSVANDVTNLSKRFTEKSMNCSKPKIKLESPFQNTLVRSTIDQTNTRLLILLFHQVTEIKGIIT